MEENILIDNNCSLAIYFLKNENKITNKKKFIENMFKILNSPKLNYLEEDDIKKFVFILEKNIEIAALSFEAFVLKDKYYIDQRSKKDLIYSFIFNHFIISPKCLHIFKIKNNDSNKNNLIERQALVFDMIRKRTDITDLRKASFTNEMIRVFEKNIAHKIKEYQDITKIKDFDYDTIFRKEELIEINSKSILDLIKKIHNKLNSEVEKNIDSYNSKIQPFMIKNPLTEDTLIIKTKEYDTEGQSINLMRYSFKQETSLLNAAILEKNINKYNIGDIIFIVDKFETNQQKRYVENIIKMLKKSEYYNALKESILFLENFLRYRLISECKIQYEYKKNRSNDVKKAFDKCFSQKSFYNKETKNILNDYLYEEYKDEYQSSIILLFDLIDLSFKEGIINKAEFIMLNFFLLNDDREGKNLRNDIFHGLKNEDDYFIKENEKNNIILFKMIIFYILSIAYSYK